ncbi:MAG: hypothetical protein IKM34_03220 [Clostridia bacterium]|nr:hypothetical protein [Clostridia bacterium]
MRALSEYMIAAFTASLIAGIGERIAPAGMKKYVTFIASLMLLIYLFTPIKSLGEELFHFADDVMENEEIEAPSAGAYDEVLALSRKKAEESIQKHLVERFRTQDSVAVSLTMEMKENGTILLTHISLKLSQRDMPFAEDIETYLEETFHTETSIDTSYGG